MQKLFLRQLLVLVGITTFMAQPVLAMDSDEAPVSGFDTLKRAARGVLSNFLQGNTSSPTPSPSSSDIPPVRGKVTFLIDERSNDSDCSVEDDSSSRGTDPSEPPEQKKMDSSDNLNKQQPKGKPAVTPSIRQGANSRRHSLFGIFDGEEESLDSNDDFEDFDDNDGDPSGNEVLEYKDPESPEIVERDPQNQESHKNNLMQVNRQLLTMVQQQKKGGKSDKPKEKKRNPGTQGKRTSSDFNALHDECNSQLASGKILSEEQRKKLEAFQTDHSQEVGSLLQRHKKVNLNIKRPDWVMLEEMRKKEQEEKAQVEAKKKELQEKHKKEQAEQEERRRKEDEERKREVEERQAKLKEVQATQEKEIDDNEQALLLKIGSLETLKIELESRVNQLKAELTSCKQEMNTRIQHTQAEAQTAVQLEINGLKQDKLTLQVALDKVTAQKEERDTLQTISGAAAFFANKAKELTFENSGKAGLIAASLVVLYYFTLAQQIDKWAMPMRNGTSRTMLRFFGREMWSNALAHAFTFRKPVAKKSKKMLRQRKKERNNESTSLS